jgi:hypothetical protein
MVALTPFLLLTGLAAVTTLVVFLFFHGPRLYRKSVERIQAFLKPDVIGQLFGEDAGILVLEKEEYEEKLKDEISAAQRSVYHISIHAYTVNYAPERRIFESSSVEQRYLLLTPEGTPNGNSGVTGQRSGIESIRDSPFDPDALTRDDIFEEKFSHFYRHLTNGDWSNIEFRLYSTTPWIRCAIIDENRAGFKITPALYDGRNTIGFWTEDRDVVNRLIDIFEDIWLDERTEEFESWYEDWKS